MNKQLIGLVLMALMLLATTGCEQQGPAERAGEKIDNAVSDGKSNFENAVENVGEKIEEAGDKIKEETK